LIKIPNFTVQEDPVTDAIFLKDLVLLKFLNMTENKRTLPFSVLTVLVLSLCAALNETNGQSIKTNSESAQEVNSTLPVYLITYDHGGVVPWGTSHFTKYLRSAADWLERYPEFKIGLDNEAYAYDYLNENDTSLLSELKGNLTKYRGRFGIGSSTYGQPLSQFINEESNIRQIGYAINTEQAVLGCRPSVYIMSEHAMHSQLPQILKGFGFTGAVMRTHFMMYGYNPTFNSPIGWWTGMDGTRLPAIPTYKGEGNAFGSDTEDNLILEVYPGPDCKESLEDFRDKFQGISPLLASRVDDSNLRQEALVQQYEGNPGFKWLLTEEIFPSFPSPSEVFKTLPDDFHVRMPWGYCGNEIWNMSREAEVKVLTAERIGALGSVRGGPNFESILHEAWKNLLIGQHHDIQICGILDESRKFLPASIAASDSIIRSSMQFMASEMSGGKQGQITIFNPLSWNRRAWVTADITIPANTSSLAILQNGVAVPYHLISVNKTDGTRTSHAKISLLADIPALACESFALAASGKKADSPKTISFDWENLRITTPFWTISLNKNGGIDSITSRKTRKYVTGKHRSCYFTGVIDGKQLESKGTWIADSAIINNNQITLLEKGTIGTIQYSLKMMLNDVSPEINFAAKVHINNERIGRVSNNEKETASAFLHEEKLRFKVFPNTGIGTEGIRDLPFTIAETDNKYVEGNYWTAIADGHAGMAFFNRGTMGSLIEEDGGFSMPLAYSMFYIWRTVLLSGDYPYEFALLPFEGRWENADLHRQALNYNFPVISQSSGKGNGTLGFNYQPFRMSSGSVILSALYTDKGETYLRFFESTGANDDLHITYENGTGRFVETDLLENELSPVNSPLRFTPWHIRTFRLDLPYKIRK
jgi:alpha-mannosidase